VARNFFCVFVQGIAGIRFELLDCARARLCGFWTMLRYLAAVAAVGLLHVPLGIAAEPTTSLATPRAALPASWMHGLRSGPNGPIPFIVVDQFGYPAEAAKFAVIRDPQIGYDNTARFTPGKTYALIEVSSGRAVKQAALSAWNGGATHEASGDKAWTFDFSDVVTPGRYAVLDVEKGIRSADFAIGDDVYREAMKHALRMFYYQRAGIDKTAKFACAAWADKASHLGAGQDQQSRPWPLKGPLPAAQTRPASEPEIKDLRGGWYDAGDYSKYTSWTARNIIVLLQAYAENPQAFGDDLGLPESGNGVPDILDEVKWGLGCSACRPRVARCSRYKGLRMAARRRPQRVAASMVPQRPRQP
jgi:endoglucanase